VSEPSIRVGLVEGAAAVRFRLGGRFRTEAGAELGPGDHEAVAEAGGVALRGAPIASAAALRLTPVDFDSCRVTVHDVVIGRGFHWQRRQSQDFQGALCCVAAADGLTLINELPLEAYLTSVISSEMSAAGPVELLRSHAIVSRSWLLAQLAGSPVGAPVAAAPVPQEPAEIRRWYDRESHAAFDVCPDDHCQRYQGITRAFSREAFEAVRSTRGVALVDGDAVCDARYSKSCGGMTEVFATAWDERRVPYLQAVYDGDASPPGLELPDRGPEAAERWILSSPPAYCRRADPAFLARILPGFDQETPDFYRWEVAYTAEELGRILAARLGRELGRVAALEPLERGPSGRIRRLRIRAETDTLVVGKELEIRRALSRSHLYSSALVVQAQGADADGFPLRFRLIGAGWGHGVGLCQIGAAAMADAGAGHERILEHYFRGARLRRLYA
jgi:peptidoglycan hydrolase-like amidase